MLLVRRSLFAVCVAFAGSMACTTSLETESGSGSNRVSNAPPFVTPLPSGDESADQVFYAADTAFRMGDFVTAHREFGTLFVIAPTYGQMATDALGQTCASLQIDCNLAIGRLELIRDAFFGAFGARSAWLPEQERDFYALLDCYEAALVNDFDRAIAAGGPVTQAPFAPFQAHANRCVAPMVAQRDAIARQRAIDDAYRAWFENFDCFDEASSTMLAAYSAGDWDAWVRAQPNYDRCAPPIDRVVASAVLDGDPRVADQLDSAWAASGQIQGILASSGATIAAVRDGLARLEADVNYQAAVVQYNQIGFDETRQLNQIASIEQVAAGLDEAARAAIDLQLQQEYGMLAQIQAAKAGVMSTINSMRAYYGLPARAAL